MVSALDLVVGRYGKITRALTVATATDGNGNTSEFGPNWVTTTLDALSPAGFNAFETDTPATATSDSQRLS